VIANVLHALAGNSIARYLAVHFPPARRAARRFVAGETLDEAMEVLRTLHTTGLRGMLDQLGESVHEEEGARRAAAEYLDGIERIRRAGVPANVSLKPTQMGLDISEALCEENLIAVVSAAATAGVFVEIDMESSAYTDRTLAIHAKLRSRFANVGVCVQAYLHRTEADVKGLIELGSRVRLVKGAYLEPADIAMAHKAEVDANYRKLLGLLFSDEAVSRGVHPCVATHDPAMIEAAGELVRRQNLGNDRYEYQMLYGIGRPLQEQLRVQGRPIRVYVSYGTQWYPYFMRRLAERPANLMFVLSHLVGG